MEIIYKNDRNAQQGTIGKFDWHELTVTYRELFEGARIPVGARLREHVEEWKSGNKEGWSGANGKEMIDFLKHGYQFEATVDPDKLPFVPYERPRMRYTDDPEGEYDHDLYMNGETEHFLTKPKRQSLIGIRLRIEYTFAWTVNAETIANYAKWVGTVVQSLQARGYDLEIEVVSHSQSVYTQSHDIDESRIRVSKFGERVMPYDWSAIFSPGGYRHLMFLAYMLPGEDKSLNMTPTAGLGGTLQSAWDIKWDPKEREIRFVVNQRGDTFPAEEMTKRFESWRDK